MRGKRFPIALVAVVLLIVLGTVGVGYTLWYDRLDMSATVKTGDVDISFVVLPGEMYRQVTVYNADMTIKQKYCTPSWTGCPLIPENKDVSTCSAEVDANGVLQIKVGNAYPSFLCEVAFRVKNTGTIPVHLFSETDLPEWVWKSPGCTLYDAQLHPGKMTGESGEPNKCILQFHFTNNDGILENTTFEYFWKVFGKQWNEAAVPIPTP